jgi:CDP-diacylglycerol--glycerol-3-phosphate 3-phosphatidyltransferase
MGHFSVAGALLIGGAIFDALDGMVARETGIASDAGEMLDAALDRYVDAAPLIGLAIFYRFSAWQMLAPLAALMGSTMVSYVRAKAEAMELSLPTGLMRRHERIAYVSVGLVVAPEVSPMLGHPWGLVHPATQALVALIALLSNYAALKLLLQARRALASRAKGRERT